MALLEVGHADTLVTGAPTFQAYPPQAGRHCMADAWQGTGGSEETRQRVRGEKKAEWQQRLTAAALAGMREERWERTAAAAADTIFGFDLCQNFWAFDFQVIGHTFKKDAHRGSE